MERGIAPLDALDEHNKLDSVLFEGVVSDEESSSVVTEEKVLSEGASSTTSILQHRTTSPLTSSNACFTPA